MIQENNVAIYKIGPQWYKAVIKIGNVKHSFFGYSKEEVQGRAIQEAAKKLEVEKKESSK